MADTTRNIFTLGEYRDDQTAGKGITVTDVWTDLFPTGAVELNINTKNDNRLDFGNPSSPMPRSHPYIQIAADADYNLGTGDFSVEGWFYAKSIYTSGHYKRLWEFGDDPSNSIGINVKMNGTIEFRYNDSVYLTSSTNTFTIGEWHHVLLHRVSGTIRLFYDGVRQQSASNSTNWNYSSNTLRIGANHGQEYTSWWNGWISNFRFLKGSASHTSSSDFVPPKPPLENITNTKILICQDKNNPAGYTVLPAGKTVYLNGSTTASDAEGGTQQASLQYVGLSRRWLGDKTETSNMGYSTGGGPSSFTNMMRLDMSTNTTSFFPGSENAFTQRQYGATASQTTGYLGGAEPSNNNVGQFNFANETASSSSPMSLLGSRQNTTGNGNITHGYITGGGPGNPGYTNTTKLDYAANTSSNLPSSSNLRQGAPSDKYTKGMNNTGNQEKGYFLGGNPGSSYIDKLIYATDVMTSTVSTVIPAGNPSSRRKPSNAATGTALADGTYGYMIGSVFTSDGPTYQLKGSWFRMTFSTDTETFMPSWNPYGGGQGAKFGNTTKGYTMGGGGPSNGSNPSNQVWEFNYATGTGTGVPGSLPAQTTQNVGMSVRNSNAPVYFPPTVTTTPSVNLVDAEYGIFHKQAGTSYEKRDFSTDGVSVMPGLQNTSNTPWQGAVANQDAIWTYSADYRGGDKIPWANQTIIKQPNSWFPKDHWYHLGNGSDSLNDSKSGYFAGGNSGTFNPAGNYPYTSEVFKIDFSTGTGYTPGSNRGQTNAWAGNSQSPDKGYSFGGIRSPSGPHTTAYYMSFPTESWSEIPGSGFPSWLSSHSAGTGNVTNGYMGGGRNPNYTYSYIWKFAYSTETGSQTPARLVGGGTNNQNFGELAATGDQEKGYWGGTPGGGRGKLVYATDTLSNISNYNYREVNSWAVSNADMNRSGKIGSPLTFQ